MQSLTYFWKENNWIWHHKSCTALLQAVFQFTRSKSTCSIASGFGKEYIANMTAGIEKSSIFKLWPA